MEIKEIRKGNTSNTHLVVTLDGKYIFRKLKDTKQAMAEFLLSKALVKQNISPMLLLSNTKQPYIKDQENIYNLQIYIENHDEKINFYHLGEIISLFHSVTKCIQGIPEQKDRFALRGMWMKLIQMEEFNKLGYKTQLFMLLEECLQYNHTNNCYIHGDLGIWNLLFNQSKIYIIDFGEVRKGNNHFDMSATISSTIDWSQGENEIINSLIDFKNGYISNYDTFNWTVLKENFTLWSTRGIIALFIKHGINERTSSHAKIIMKRIDQMNRLLNANFH